MHYELWEFRSRSLLATYPSEGEALAMVRALLTSGWSPCDLALGVAQRGRRSKVTAPEPLTGDALAIRAQAAGEEAGHSA
jgi:hypothetical protein